MTLNEALATPQISDLLDSLAGNLVVCQLSTQTKASIAMHIPAPRKRSWSLGDLVNARLYEGAHGRYCLRSV